MKVGRGSVRSRRAFPAIRTGAHFLSPVPSRAASPLLFTNCLGSSGRVDHFFVGSSMRVLSLFLGLLMTWSGIIFRIAHSQTVRARNHFWLFLGRNNLVRWPGGARSLIFPLRPKRNRRRERARVRVRLGNDRQEDSSSIVLVLVLGFWCYLAGEIYSCLTLAPLRGEYGGATL
jgi:uncharacterized membrane protein HdeD (DUF308 family)